MNGLIKIWGKGLYQKWTKKTEDLHIILGYKDYTDEGKAKVSIWALTKDSAIIVWGHSLEQIPHLRKHIRWF